MAEIYRKLKSIRNGLLSFGKVGVRFLFWTKSFAYGHHRPRHAGAHFICIPLFIFYNALEYSVYKSEEIICKIHFKICEEK
jgi:hypothetical protein